MKRILVVGSLNMDIVIETPCMPKAGETIAGKSIAQIPGGKGANQAFAAGKLGGNIAMMGAVGNDEKGEKLLESLKGVGVDISRIEVMNDIPTGQAFITVDDQGENAIIIIAGANGKVTKELIDSNLDLIKQSDIIIMQLEIPLEIVGYVKKIVEEDGKIVILDPAPAIKDIPENKQPLLLMLDGLEDPHNLGAILRTCDAVGVDGVIIGKNRSVGLNGTVAKVSTGAIHHVKVAQVTNLTRTLEDLKKKAFWVVGCELENSQDYRSVDYNMPTVLVIGSEGFGMSRLVKKSCDINVVLPMVGHVNSLNASVAASVLLYQVYNSRHPL